MAFCANCGARLEEDAMFCPNCGAKQEIAPPSPIAPTASGEYGFAPVGRTSSQPPAPAPAAGETAAAGFASTEALRAEAAAETALHEKAEPETTAAPAAVYPSAEKPAAPAAAAAPTVQQPRPAQTPPMPRPRPVQAPQTGTWQSAPAYATAGRTASPLTARGPSFASKTLMVFAMILVLLQLVTLLFLPIFCVNGAYLGSRSLREYNIFNENYGYGFGMISTAWLRAPASALPEVLAELGFCAALVLFSLISIVLLCLGIKAKHSKACAVTSMILMLLQTGLYVLGFFLFNTALFRSPMANPPGYLFTVFGYACGGMAFAAMLLCLIRVCLRDRRRA